MLARLSLLYPLLTLIILPGLASRNPSSDLALPARYKVGIRVLPNTGNIRSDYEALALRRCLASMGVPFDVLHDFPRLGNYDLILAAGDLLNTSFGPAEREKLFSYVEQGGVLLAFQVRGSQYFPLFGITESHPTRTRFRLRFKRPDSDPALRYLNRPEEQEISLGNPELFKETIWSSGYRLGRARPLGNFSDGKIAFARNEYGRGLTYVLGVSLTQVVLQPQMALTFEAYRQWVNSFEPSSDVFSLILRALYEDIARPGVRWHTLPEGNKTALILSHDIDARESFRNSLIFAQMEKQEGVTSTFFVTTKNFTDETDIGYYGGESISYIGEVKKLGFDIGSHSVSHSKQFESFPLGNATVNAASYQPLQEKPFTVKSRFPRSCWSATCRDNVP